jgi:hypothetical protein
MDSNIFDPQYVQKQQVASLQQMAAQQNALRVQLYQQASTDWVTTNLRNRDLNLPVTPPPTMPKKIVVSDAGDWLEVPFDNLQVPVLPAPTVGLPSGSLRPSGSVPPDRTDQILAALQLLNGKLDTLLNRQ